MSLPKWIERIRERWFIDRLPPRDEVKAIVDLTEALTIAVEALGCYENKKDPVYQFKDPSELAKEALRRIEELGK